jgi:hypothetical protein
MYHEYHFQGDIGVAFEEFNKGARYTKIWICLDGASLLRAKLFNGKLLVEFTPPEEKKDGNCKDDD